MSFVEQSSIIIRQSAELATQLGCFKKRVIEPAEFARDKSVFVSTLVLLTHRLERIIGFDKKIFKAFLFDFRTTLIPTANLPI